MLGAVDYFTDATCSVPDVNDTVLNCIGEQEKALCKDNGGICIIEQDGYYVVSIICVILGALTLFGFVKPHVKNLQSKFVYICSNIILFLLYSFMFACRFSIRIGSEEMGSIWSSF